MTKISLISESRGLVENQWQKLIASSRTTALGQVNLIEPSHQSETISLQELTGTAMLRIHSLRSCTQLNTALSGCDFKLPENVNQSLGQDPAVICQAPGNWLLFSEYLRSNRLYKQLYSALDDDDTNVLDLTAGLTTFRLAGDGVKWLMSKLCGLDFFAVSGQSAHAAQTRIQHAAVSLHYHQPGTKGGEYVLDVIIERSIASYLWYLLVDAIPHAEELQKTYG